MTFKPGVSGCVTGRPKGITDKRTSFRKLLEPHAPEMITKLIEMAKAGEPTAMRLVIDRLIPRLKTDETIVFELPEGRIDKPDNIVQIVNDITQAVASGEMTIEEALKFNNFLNNQRRNIQNAEYEQKAELAREERRRLWEAQADEEDASEDS